MHVCAYTHTCMQFCTILPGLCVRACARARRCRLVQKNSSKPTKKKKTQLLTFNGCGFPPFLPFPFAVCWMSRFLACSSSLSPFCLKYQRRRRHVNILILSKGTKADGRRLKRQARPEVARFPARRWKSIFFFLHGSAKAGNGGGEWGGGGGGKKSERQAGWVHTLLLYHSPVHKGPHGDVESRPN